MPYKSMFTKNLRIYSLINHHAFKCLLLLFILLFPMFFVWQGLDFTDLGYSLTNYQQIFNDPLCIERDFAPFWLTNIVGGLWLFFFESFGIVGVKFGGALICYLTMLFVFLSLKEYMPHIYILFGLAISLFFINSVFQITWIHYNNLTALFYVISAFYLFKGIVKQRLIYIGIAGFFSGLNLFVRISNAAGFVLIIASIYYGIINKKEKNEILLECLIFLLGYVISIGIIMALMKMMGHYDLFFDSLAFMQRSGVGGDYLFSLRGLEYFLKEREKAFLLPLIITSLVFLLTKIFSKMPDILVFICVCIIAFYSIRLLHILSMWRWIFPGFLFWILILHICRYRNEEIELSALAFISIVVLALAPLGSTNGMRISIYGMWLPIPIALYWLLNLKPFKVWILEFNKQNIITANLIVIIPTIMFSASNSVTQTYRDARFWNLTASVDRKFLKGLYTTPARADVVKDLLDALDDYVKSNDYLFAYEHIPLVYFLTKTRPYLYTSWPMLLNPKIFDDLLNRAIQEKRILPVIVRAKAYTATGAWPGPVEKLGLVPMNAGNRKYIAEFINEYKYDRIWENSFFEIFKAQSEQ